MKRKSRGTTLILMFYMKQKNGDHETVAEFLVTLSANKYPVYLD